MEGKYLNQRSATEIHGHETFQDGVLHDFTGINRYSKKWKYTGTDQCQDTKGNYCLSNNFPLLSLHLSLSSRPSFPDDSEF